MSAPIFGGQRRNGTPLHSCDHGKQVVDRYHLGTVVVPLMPSCHLELIQLSG
jgi:hypothetical protein